MPPRLYAEIRKAKQRGTLIQNVKNAIFFVKYAIDCYCFLHYNYSSKLDFARSVAFFDRIIVTEKTKSRRKKGLAISKIGVLKK